VANFIVRPLIFAIDGPVGAILGGLLWPMVLAWLILLVLLLIFAIIGPGVTTTTCSISSGC
jgi:hypothetical protein